ncbi:unnamed protein product [Macrosiphum euphorbiae]|nr:unnamed protein product [Macrosiphum euphorbiae]
MNPTEESCSGHGSPKRKSDRQMGPTTKKIEDSEEDGGLGTNETADGGGATVAKTHEPENIRIDHDEERPDERRNPFGFLRHLISDGDESVSSDGSDGDYFRGLPSERNRCSDSPEEMDEFGDTEDMGGYDDVVGDRDDDTLQSNQEKYEDLIVQLGRELASKFMSGIHRYVSSIIVPLGVRGVQRCLRELDYLIDKYPPQHFYVIAKHDDHIHISHICGYSGGCCRCAFIIRGTFWRVDGRRRLRRITRGIDMQAIDYGNVLRYLSTGGRSIQRIGGFSENGRLFDRYKYLSAYRHLGQTEGGLLDGSYGAVQRDIPCEPSSSEHVVKSGENDGGGDVTSKKSEARKKKSWVRPENGPVSITELLYQYPCCPPEAYKNVKEYYLNDNLNYLCAKDKYVDRDLELWNIKLMHWRLIDFDNYYKDDKVHPYFNAYNRLRDQVYYNVDKSVEIANELLLHQFDNNTENVFYFLTDLINVLDKRIPIYNTLAILAPPNAGKNYFFDAVASFFINYGTLGTANKTNNFAFMEAAGKRLVLWNEPNYETNHVNELKALLGGDSCKISVKYKSDQALQGPPIIILTNDNLSIFGMSAFQTRIKLYHWQSAPFLRLYDKKINPLFLLRLFEMYNININQ